MANSILILIVDDEPAIQFAVTDYFTAYGFEVDCAGDAARAAELLTSRVYGAVIADFRLSDSVQGEGLGVVALANLQHPRPGIVLLSAYSSPLLIQYARRMGADVVLQKPLPLAELRQHIVELLERRDTIAKAAVENSGLRVVPPPSGSLALSGALSQMSNGITP